MHTRTATVGRPFTLAVRDAVRAAKDDDVLRAVTVVVPSNLAGLSLRRLLGSDLLDDEPTRAPAGIANVAFATPFQFASGIAGAALAASGVRPLTTAVLAAAVRHVLRTSPGRFAAVAEHTATETALVRAYAEVTTLSAEHRRLLAAEASPRVASLVALIAAVEDRLGADGPDAGYHDESAVFAAAVDVLRNGGGREAESIVLAAPFDQGETARHFLAETTRHFSWCAVVALSGDTTVDEAAVAQIAEITGAVTDTVDETAGAPVAPPLPTRLEPVADVDEEARAVVRSVVELVESGEPLDRIAVFHPSRNPYARTLREQFDQAALPTAGPDHRRLRDSMAGRLVRRILELATPGERAEHLSRAGVLALANAAPVRGPDGKPLRPGPWEEVSRKAGVIGGLEDWQIKLSRHLQNLDDRTNDERNAERTAGFFDALERERRATESLRRFVEWIETRTDPAVVGRTWQERSSWALALLTDLLPTINRRNTWPEIERDAADRIEVVLKRVAVLERLEPDASYGAFVRAVEIELDVPTGSRGRFGTGVLIAPLAAAAGIDVDHVFVVGLSEGVCPRPIREDTLLPDADRDVLPPGLLATRDDRLREQRRRFLTALGAGTRTRTLVMPLGDHRNGRLRTASRWWIEALRGLGADPTITSQTWPGSDVVELGPGGSFTQSNRRAAAGGVTISIADLEHQNVLLSGVVHPDDVVAQRSITMEAAVRSGYSRFSGDLGAVDMDPVTPSARPMSATRLETWAACPRKYFFAEVLGLGAIDAPDAITEISALDRGSLWHSVLEDFISDALPGAAHAPPHPGHRWTEDDRRRLRAHASARFAEYEEAGLTGRPLLWGIQKENLLADLDTFLEKDSDMRAELGTRPQVVELSIGMGEGSDAPAARVGLPDGRELTLRGFADRVDVRSDGTPVVIDYKTGSSKLQQKKAQTVLDEDPVCGGTKLQLGVYAEAARQHFGTDRSSAWYWYTSEKGSFARAGYEWTTRHHEVFARTLQTIVSGIEGGLFPPNPGEFNGYFQSFDACRFCDFTSICSQRRDEEHAHALADDRLAPFVAMHDPPTFAEGETDHVDENGSGR